ncbi:hypothetical protein BLNAU_6916 [Blattamonas nauphoetae]|uniref:Uncharacterized protein n=1 Tax=Blattamonas nauphoetae TaxID=2049346 RepID=A0ABQ9Y398_9EUKA|nr:hypothetical protein BLNAU_6916 [Blattamonas nauphoetae]
MSIDHHDLPISLDETNQPPLFLAAPPIQIESIQTASPLFVSLVQYIEEGNTLNDIAVHKAECLLEQLVELLKDASDKPFYEKLAPSKSKSADVFCEAILTLLASGYPSLVNDSLHILRYSFRTTPLEERFSLISSGFFIRLASTLQSMMTNLTAQALQHLLGIVRICSIGGFHEDVEHISRSLALSSESVCQIVLERELQPMTPFISFCCVNRFDVPDDSLDSSLIVRFLIQFLRSGLFHEPTLAFVFSLPTCLVITRNILSLALDHSALMYQTELAMFFGRYQRPDAFVTRRRKAVLSKLNEEGHADELEMFSFWHPSESYRRRIQNYSMGAMDYEGSNLLRAGRRF